MIYLDYSANTPADPAVLDAFCQTERRYIGNPNSTHPAGQAAREEMDQVTGSIAVLLGVEPEEIIYTSGASESNNLALKGIVQSSRHVGRHIISTVLEHSSVGGALSALQQQGCEVDLVDIRRDGTVDLEHLRELLRKDTVLVSVCAVDSELGTAQPIREMAAILKDYPNCRLHVDATQAVGKTELVLDGVDTMSIAPHKFYGLNGSGLLMKKKGLVIEPQIHGGACAGAGSVHRNSAGAGLGQSDTTDRLCQGAEPPPAGGACQIPGGTHQQSGKRRAPHSESQRQRRQGDGFPAGIGGAGRLRVGEVRLLGGGHALQGGVRREPRPEKRPVLVAHQPQPPDHRRRNRGIPANFSPLLSGTGTMKELPRQKLSHKGGAYRCQEP